MTMKTKKTLQHIAAVAVVLLTLCLVFAAPVSADDTTKFVLEVAQVNEGGMTTFYVNSDKTQSYNLQSIMGNSYLRPTQDTPWTLPDGAIVELPADTIYLNNQVNVYGNVSLVGAGEDSTKIVICGSAGWGKSFMLMNRFQTSVVEKIVYTTNFKNFTIDKYPGYTKSSSAITLTCYNIILNMEDVTVNNMTRGVISANVNDELTDETGNTVLGIYPSKSDNAGVVINLYDVDTTDNQRTIIFDFNYETTDERYGFAYLNFDSECNINDEQLFEVHTSATPYLGNMLINGEDITLSSAVAKIGDNYYGTLDEAVLKAKDGETVTLLKEVEIAAPLTISKSITIDGGEDTILITGPADNSVFYLKGEEGLAVTLKNLMVEGKYAVKVGSPKTTLNVDNALLFGYAAVYLRSYENDNADGSKVIIANSALVGFNDYNAPSNDFGTIAVLANNTEISIQNTDVYAIANKTANQSILRFGADSVDKDYANAKVSITGNSILDIDGPTAKFLTIGTGGNFTGVSQQILGAGVTANFNPSAYIAPNMEVVQPGDKYLVQEYVDRSSSSSSSVKPEEPVQPEEPVEPTPETPAAPGEVVSSTEVTDGGDVTFETPAGEDGTAPAAADDEVKGVVLPTGTEGTVEFVPVSETPAPAGQEENTKRVFEINVPSYKKGEASVIKFQMTVAEIEADGKTAADVALWHFDEETGE